MSESKSNFKFLRKISSQVFYRNTTSDSANFKLNNDDQQAAPPHNCDNASESQSGHNLNIPFNDPDFHDPDNTDFNIPHSISISNDIPRNILAFRTITTILSLIQQERPFKVSHSSATPEGLSKVDRQLLKILNAVSNLAVANYDVTAVTTKSSPETLEVITCTTRHSKYEHPHTYMQSNSQNSTKISKIWELIVTKNFRRDDTRSPTWESDPTIIDATAPAGLDPDDDEELKKYLNKRWSKSTLSTHLWILSKVLLMKGCPFDGGPIDEEPTDEERLLLYVISTCYPKMNRRINHKTLSMPYMTSLENVEAVPYHKSLHMEASTDEKENDRLFLVKFLKPAIEANWFNKAIPKLYEQATLAEKSKPFQLYTEDTCMEFHFLLCDLLRQFKKSLKKLAESRKEVNVPTEGSNDFKGELFTVMLNGHGLQRISRGSALRMHLQNIAPLLNDHRDDRMSMPKFPKADGNEEGNGFDECDEELKAVQPSVVTSEGVPMPLWQSYQDWLRLMVIHFDAVDVLEKYVKGPDFCYSTISIKILVPPPVNNTLLPWQELINDPTLFPTKNSQDPRSTITNDEILKFLSNATKSDPGDALKWAVIAKRKWENRNADNTIKQIKLFENSALPGFHDCAKKVLEMLRAWKAQPSETLFRNITQSIQSLLDNAKFFNALKGIIEFKGTLHCEVCLISFLNRLVNDERKYEELLAQLMDFGRVIGISKRCCPVCRHLLSLVTKDTPPFVVSGSHNTVTACTLPTWLPGDIVDSMNEFFGAQLRRELVEVMTRSELMRGRAQSTGSQRLSLDSVDGRVEDNRLPISARFQAAAKRRDEQLNNARA